MALLKQQFLSGDWATIVHRWRYPPPEIGRYGDDLLLRAADQSMAGIMCNDPAEGVYLVNFEDASGEKLKADRRYRIHFDADNMPPVDSFWSLGMYGTDLNLVANPINRYSIGDRTAGLSTDADGGLTIWLQSESPGDEDEANWLPSPAEGEWFVNAASFSSSFHKRGYRALWRAVEARNPTLVTAAALELGRLSLADALAVCLVFCDHDPARFERAAVRWLGRFCCETRGLTLADAHLVLALLPALRGPAAAAATRALSQVRTAYALDDVAEVLDQWTRINA